jgi:hypothetical protein
VPSAPPTATPPLAGISSSLVVDLTEASRLATRASEMLADVPLADTGTADTKDLRIRIFKTNMAAQKRLEQQMSLGNPDAVLSDLRRADAHLEDANWQLQNKPSPDGRFTGVDVPGAVRDTAEGARIIEELLRSAGGHPSTPGTPPPVQPPTLPPSEPDPGTPPAPPTTPPATPPVTPPTTTPPDSDYPGEDEFPTDSDILAGGDG